MDWNRPTTKKHIKEAEAQGCKLLGAGKSARYRLYALPCGHEQQVCTGRMRTGGFRCQTCLDEKLNHEAEIRGCKLDGAGRSALYRLYALPCGHKQEVGLRHMRDGGFSCQTCLAEKQLQEAEAQGCKLIGDGKSRKSRLYVLPCGHEQDVGISNMRNGSFRCSVCLDEKMNQDATAQGCKLLGAGKSGQHRLYEMPCGHEQEVEVGNMRKGHFGCKTCLAEKMNREAEAQGCKLIGAGRTRATRLYALPCGHEQEVQLIHMRPVTYIPALPLPVSTSRPSRHCI